MKISYLSHSGFLIETEYAYYLFDYIRGLLPRSTDIGVAYVIKEKTSGYMFYHAGDLNRWHWNGELKSWNRNMEINYKREIEM